MIINFFSFCIDTIIWKFFDKRLNQNVAKGDFFQRDFCRSTIFDGTFFLWKFWYVHFSKLQDTKLSFQEVICNFFYGSNLQILSVQIAIRKLANPRNENLKVFGIFIKRAFLSLPWTRPSRLRDDLLATIKKNLNMLFLKNNKKTKLAGRHLLQIAMVFIP